MPSWAALEAQVQNIKTQNRALHKEWAADSNGSSDLPQKCNKSTYLSRNMDI